MSRPLPILQGRRFGCTQCGNCCIEPGFVFMYFEEMKAMAAHLEMRLRDFKDRFGVKWDPGAGQWLLSATDGQGCPLLTEDRGCSVHPVKPIQCSTFPFWQEHLDDEASWEAAKKYCPGMDAEDARVYTAEEIREIRDEVHGT